ncbi:hypothetical protein LWC33_13215 [Pseudonocardia sp. RS11V-5]|uniref:nSTAND1 domain-containing NTPase n=1 Tax=Pseudonocardia terrae TaxID=2905831 RepID=UPI001E349654|nr:hypothetical protein [Pseudonocardia terrae]MCE3552417.1 hypothetical protein [Pseudonocardia terrae]
MEPETDRDPENGTSPAVRMEALADNESTVNQAGRDLHVHFEQGVRRAIPVRPATQAPYPGLAAFTADQQDIFFGRDRQIAELLALIDENVAVGGIHVLLAASGAGKTSLLHAGVIPRLRHGVLPGSAGWTVVALTPTDDPVAELSDRLREVESKEPLLVVVDQFEQLYTACPEDRREGFVQLLSKISSSGADPRCLVVVAVRSDFFEACARSSTLRESLQRRALVLGPMSIAEVRTAITAPAATFGLTLESGLVEVLLRDLGFAAGAASGDAEVERAAAKLPLLAHALRSTWRQRHGDTLTIAGYGESGGVSRAVTQSAETIFSSLSKEQQSVARAVFLRLTWIGDGFEVARRRVSATELHEAVDSPHLSNVLERFTAQRLLARDGDHVEITHEALLQAWPRLRSWLDDDRAGNITRQEIRLAATEWASSGGDPDLLYRGARLETATAWVSTTTGEVDSAARLFINTSTGHATRQRRIRRAVLALLMTLALVAVVGGVAALQQARIASEQERLAFASAISANADRLRLDDVATAAQLDMRAYDLRPDGTAYTNLVESGNASLSFALEGHTSDVMAVAYSPDGRILATGGADDSIRFWGLAGTAAPVLSGVAVTARPVLSIAFVDGDTVAVGESGGGIEVFRVRDASRVGSVLQAHRENVNALSYSARTGILASAGEEGAIRFWAIRSGLPFEPAGRDISTAGVGVTSLDFDAYGSTFVEGRADGSIATWDVRNFDRPYLLATMPVHDERLTAVAYSSDARLIASGSFDGTVQLLGSQNKSSLTTEAERLTPGVGAVASLAYSPDDLTLAVAGYTGEVVMYSLVDPTEPRYQWMPLRGHLGDVGSIAFSPDGKTLASGGRDHLARVWHLRNSYIAVPGPVRGVDYLPEGDRLALWTESGIQIWDVATEGGSPRVERTWASPYPGKLGAFALSEDSRWMAAGDENGFIHFWKAGTGGFEYVSSLQSEVGWITAMEIDQDSGLLAVGGTSGEIRLVDLRTPTPSSYPTTLTGHEGDVASLTFSRDSRTLLSAGTDTDIRVWNVAAPATPTQLSHRPHAHTDLGTTVSYSPDGLTIVTASYDNTARLWRLDNTLNLVATGEPIDDASSFLMSVAWADDGALLATGSWDSQVRLYTVNESGDAAPRGDSLRNQGTAVSSLDFSPDGRTLAVGGTNGIVLLLSLDAEVLKSRICASSSLDEASWHEAMRSDVEFVPACGS